MSLTETLKQDMKTALRAGDKLELGALRMALAAIQRQEIEARGALGDDAVVSVIGKLIKQGRDAEQQFEAGGRSELAAKEAAEIAVFERYLPKALGDDEVEALIARSIETSGATGASDMGRVMAAIKAEAAGRVDMSAVSARVREILSAR
ncbi:MAG TPA: GatB/YqeY domain-containing protein [Gammaproteobacteria bacterium]|nr:GatB/YqeY domain-containing protein [Gammaproteobacteria bacterium]